MMRDAVSGGKERNPSDQIPVSEIDWNIVKSNEDSLTWFGHSAFLLSIDRKNTRRPYAGSNCFTRIIHRKQTLQRRHPAYGQ